MTNAYSLHGGRWIPAFAGMTVANDACCLSPLCLAATAVGGTIHDAKSL